MTVCASISRNSGCAKGLGSAVVSTAAFGISPKASGRLDVTPNNESIRLKSQSARRRLEATGTVALPFAFTWFQFVAALVLTCFASLLQAAEPGNRVVVVYNSRVPESKDIANHNAEMPAVTFPARPNPRLYLELPTEEIMTRAAYRDELAGPLLQFMKNKSLLVYDPPSSIRPTNAKIRYVVLCYGVPLRIAEDPSLNEPGMDKVQPEFRRNGAAVDSELCTLPTQDTKLRLTGPLQNPGYAGILTNAITFNPINGLLIIARLDGPICVGRAPNWWTKPCSQKPMDCGDAFLLRPARHYKRCVQIG